ncbi:MAG: efflux RND transporter periplasmic adaptor subunit [Phycisphaerae bacterium]|nr:efflux RND transporter periplasmic adaptor subunit [Phycisphaerae bacterium]
MTHPAAGSRSKLRRGMRYALVACAGLAVGGVYLAIGGAAPQPKAPQITTDRTAAKLMGFEIVTTATGELEARNKEEYRNPLDQESTIVKIVPEGTRVKAGDLLVQLNVEAIQIKVDEERLKVESALADKVAAESNVEIQKNENASRLRQAELKLALAELALEQWRRGDVQKKRNELQLDVDRAALELERLAQLFLRSQELNAEGFLSKDQLDKDEILYIEAIAKYKTSILASNVYEDYEFRKDEKKFLSDVEEAAAEIERVKLNNRSELANKEAALQNRTEQLVGLQNRLAKFERQRQDANIIARRDGLVVYSTTLDRGMRWGGGGGDGPLQIGTQVYPNQLLIVLPDTSEMVAALRVHESMSARVRPGQTVAVRVDAAGGSVFHGMVDSIGVMAETGGWRDPNLREYTVRVALDVKGDNLKPAMRCEGRIILDTVAETLTVPVQAVFNEGPVQYVYTPRGPKFVRMPVRLGRRSDTVAEISKGLTVGDIVLVREPASGEVISEPWNKDLLIAAGYKLGDDGKVIAEGGLGRPPVGGAPPAGRSGGDRPGGRGNREGGSGGRNQERPQEGSSPRADASTSSTEDASNAQAASTGADAAAAETTNAPASAKPETQPATDTPAKSAQ